MRTVQLVEKVTAVDNAIGALPELVDKIAAIEGEAMTTVQSRFYKFTGDYPSSKPGIARFLTNDETEGGRAGAYIYNPKREGKARGLGSSEGGGS